ncbi:MAG: efflux RND transporter periplasmic adaptor subunit [Azospirillaceae bacterium]
MSLLKQSVVLLLVAAVVAGGWWWQSREAGGAESRSGGWSRGGSGDGIPVVVESVPLVADTTVVEAVGTGRALRSVTVTPAAAGRVVEVTFEAGDRVAAGAVLVRLDDEDEAAAVELAEVEVEQARQVLRRYEQARPTGAVSALEVDSARTDLRLAELALRRAEIALADRVVRAPFAGVTGIAEIDVGARVDDATEITSLDDRSAILVDFEVPEAHAGLVAPGDTVDLTAWSLGSARLEGTVTAIGSRLDPETRQLGMRARVENSDDRLRPGMSFAIALSVTGERYPAVPEVAVAWDRDGAHVWRVRQSAADRVTVDIVRRDGAMILVEGDLAEGELVVAEGVQRMRQGVALAIVNGIGVNETGGQDDPPPAEPPSG